MIMPQEGAVSAAEAALESGALYLEYLVWSRRVESFDVLM
jgi:hypothetical protein